MPRFLITDPIPRAPSEIPLDTLMVAPSQFIGAPGQCSSLQNIAKNILKRNGFGIATPVKAAETLRHAVQRVLPQADASAVARHHREVIGAMLRSGVDAANLGTAGSHRSQTAALIAERYIGLLGRERLIDSEAVLSTVVREKLVRPAKVLVYGYFRGRQLPARPEEIEFIDTLADDGSCFYLPCADEPLFHSNRQWRDWLIDQGWEVVDREREPQALTPIEILAFQFAAGMSNDPGTPDASIEAFEYPDLETEVRATLARVKSAALAGTKLGSIAIVCRNIDLYADSLIATAREYRVAIHIDCDVPIGQTSFGQFVSLFFDTLEKRKPDDVADGKKDGREGFRYEPMLRLMLHRFGPGLTYEQRGAAYTQRPDTYEKWREIAVESDRLRTDVEMDGSAWTGWLKKLFFDWDLRGRKKLGSSATDIVAFDRFFDSLDQLSRERGESELTVTEFASDVLDVLANVKTPIHAERGGVPVLLPNVVVGSEFQKVFVMGMAEGILPTPSSDSNVIDFHEREKLRSRGIHFENALEVPRWEALTFYFSLLACRGEIVFSFPRFAAENEQIASSYFKRMGISPRRDETHYVSSLPESRRAYLTLSGRKEDEVLSHARHQFRVERRRESAQPHDEYDGVTGIAVDRTYWSATSLSKIGACPFKWFASEVLRLNEATEADADLRPDLRGRLYHRTLEQAVKKAKDSEDVRSETIAALDEEFAKAEAEEFATSLIANWELRRSEHLDKLKFAVAAKKFFTDGADIVGTEISFSTEFNGLTLGGKIDRVDRLPDGKLHPIDYKTGGYIAKIKDENGDLKIDIQLAIYSLIAMPRLFPGEPTTSGIYFNLTKGEAVKGTEVALKPLLDKFKLLLANGLFPVDPDNKRRTCEYCPYDIVCRGGPRLENKEAPKQ